MKDRNSIRKHIFTTSFITGGHLTTDGKDDSIMRKKRVLDEKMIKELLTVKSPLKLTLKQFRFLLRRQARDTMTHNQRMWITYIYEDLKAIKSKNK